MVDVNPYPVPDDVHPYVRYLIRPGGIAFDGDVLDAIARHVEKVGFIHLGDFQDRREVTINVGLPNREAHVVAEPGEEVDWRVPEGWRSYCRVEGQLPPGIELVGDRLVGVCAMPGIWTVDIVTGPAVKYDALDGGGAPLEEGEWIPVGQPRKVPTRAASGVNLTGLCREELDDVIAQAEAAKRDLEVEP